MIMHNLSIGRITSGPGNYETGICPDDVTALVGGHRVLDCQVEPVPPTALQAEALEALGIATYQVVLVTGRAGKVVGAYDFRKFAVMLPTEHHGYTLFY